MKRTTFDYAAASFGGVLSIGLLAATLSLDEIPGTSDASNAVMIAAGALLAICSLMSAYAHKRQMDQFTPGNFGNAGLLGLTRDNRSIRFIERAATYGLTLPAGLFLTATCLSIQILLQSDKSTTTYVAYGMTLMNFLTMAVTTLGLVHYEDARQGMFADYDRQANKRGTDHGHVEPMISPL